MFKNSVVLRATKFFLCVLWLSFLPHSTDTLGPCLRRPSRRSSRLQFLRPNPLCAVETKEDVRTAQALEQHIGTYGCGIYRRQYRNTHVMVRVCTASILLTFLLVLKSSRAKLRPESELKSNCFDFPRQNFDRKNSIRGEYGISPHLMMQAGQDAIDFTLHDLDGNSWNLGDALGKGMPVVLIWGMFTCPAYQGMGTTAPWDKCGYWDQIDLVSVIHPMKYSVWYSI